MRRFLCLFIVAVLSVLFIENRGLTQNDDAPKPPDAEQPTTAPPEGETTKPPTIRELLEKLSMAYTQPDKKTESYRVIVEADGAITPVVCTEYESTWKHADGTPLKYVWFASQISKTYSKDVEPSRDLLLKMAELNDGAFFVHFGLYRKAETGDWSIWTNSQMWLDGATPDELSNYLYSSHYRKVDGDKNLMPLVEEGQ